MSHPLGYSVFKMTNTATNITTLDFDKITAFPNNRIRISENDRYFDIEQEFAKLIEGSISDDDARYLLDFCEQLSFRIVRMFLVEDDIDVISEFLAKELQCDLKQAQCLIELTLELIHIKVHGDFRQCHNVDLSYVITMATAALSRQ